MKALITGATGYIGSKLAERLVREGWEVFYLLRQGGRPAPERLLQIARPLEYDGSIQSLVSAVGARIPDVVFHLASLFVAEHRSDQVTDLINSNLLFSTQLAEACARAGVKRFINTGTSWQHYRETGYDPVCLYAATKQAFEDILDYYADAFGMRVVTLKIFDTYGSDDPRPKIVNLLARVARSGESLDMSPGEQRMELVHIDDVTRAFAQCGRELAETAAPEQGHLRYALSANERLSLRELAQRFARLSGAEALPINFGGRSYRQREVMEPWNGGVRLPGWSPAVGLDQGLAGLLGK